MSIPLTIVFAHAMAAWSLGLGFVFLVLMVILVACGITYGHLKTTTLNPLRPLIRWVDRWQESRLRLRELELRYKIRKETPGWEEFMEKQRDDPGRTP